MSDMKGLFSSAGIPVPLKEIDVSVTINGFVADVQSSSLYINTEESPIEAIFTFPLDDQSAVYKFEADIDGRHLIAECHEKDKAKEIYDDALASGHTAMLLQEDESAGDIFRCKLGNLPSKAEAKISTGFATELDLEADGKANFTLPTILNPRYSPDLGGLSLTEKATCTTANAIPYKLKFQLTVRCTQKIKGILGTNDKLNVEYSEDQRVAKVTLTDEFKFDHDLSVLVEYEDCNVPQIVLEKGNPNSGGMLKEDVLMVNFFLEPPAQISRTHPGEFIFVIDRSGSMQGEKIQSAKETLLLFLKSLPVNSYFNVIGFGSHFESLFQEGSLKYNEENLKKAEELQRQMEADMGGTEILQPLEHIFKQKLIDNYPRQLFVLTDGEVHNTGDVVKLAGSNSQYTRVFTVGIGQGASTALVRGLAKAGKGKEVFVKDTERLQSKVMSLLQCAMQPVATDVEIILDLSSAVTTIMMPAKIPYLFLGVRQILYVMLSGTEGVDPSIVCSLTLKGKLLSKPFEYKETFNLQGTFQTGTSAHIHSLTAKAQMKDLQLNDAPKELIVTISKSANVISKHTAFVMVDTEGKLVEGMSVERIVPAPSTVPTLGTFCSKPSPRKLPSVANAAKASSPPPTSISRDAVCTLNSTRSVESLESDAKKDFEVSEEKSASQRMMDVIRFQTFQGSWRFERQLLNLLGADAVNLKLVIPLQVMQTKPGPNFLDGFHMSVRETFSNKDQEVTCQGHSSRKNDDVVSTVTVIAWLRKYHSEKRDEWQMLETKALAWLEGLGLPGQPVEDLISSITVSIFSN